MFNSNRGNRVLNKGMSKFYSNLKAIISGLIINCKRQSHIVPKEGLFNLGSIQIIKDNFVSWQMEIYNLTA